MSISRTALPARFAFLVAMFVALSVLASSTPAQTPQGHEITKVVGHLPLENIHVNQMFVQKRGEKYFLYLHRPNKDAFALVDVTNPSKPVLVNRDEMEGNVQAQPLDGNSAVALSVVQEGQEHSGPLPTETVQLLNMANPKEVKVIKTFKGVTAYTPDDGRKLVYLVNSEGLWIVSHHMTHPLPLCNSESEISPLPNCQ
jgi:hypothetical protein